MNQNQANFILRACHSLSIKAHVLNPCERATNTFGVLMNDPDFEILFLHFSNGTGPFATNDPNAPESFRCDPVFTQEPRVALFWVLFYPPSENERIPTPWAGESLLIPRHLFS